MIPGSEAVGVSIWVPRTGKSSDAILVSIWVSLPLSSKTGSVKAGSFSGRGDQ